MKAEAYRYCPQCRAQLTLAVRGNARRAVCPDCGFVHWNNPVPVVAAIVESEGQVILVRSRGWPATWFGLVAGFVEPGESIDRAVSREVHEEIGVSVDATTFLGSYPFDRMNQLLFVFHAVADARRIVLDEGELEAYRRVPIDRLLPWSRGTGLAVRDWLASRGIHREPVEFGEHIL